MVSTPLAANNATTAGRTPTVASLCANTGLESINDVMAEAMHKGATNKGKLAILAGIIEEHRLGIVSDHDMNCSANIGGY